MEEQILLYEFKTCSIEQTPSDETDSHSAGQ